jgi:hypothetical protein
MPSCASDIGHLLDTNSPFRRKPLILLALPREAHEASSFKNIAGSLGEITPTELQGVSGTSPKPLRRSASKQAAADAASTAHRKANTAN